MEWLFRSLKITSVQSVNYKNIQMKGENLKGRTFRFSIDIIDLVQLLPKNKATDVISYQILKWNISWC